MNRIPEKSEFERVKSEAENACKLAIEKKLKCCANLADLHCIEVLWCLDEAGDAIWLVRLSEASPDDAALESFVRDHLHLADMGYPVTVETEW